MTPFESWIEADWPAPSRIKAGTTTREGGVSQGAFSGFNLATHVNDETEHVITNRQQLVSALALPTQPAWLEQVHSCDIVDAGQVAGVVLADAAFTTEANKVCCVMTADCLPLLLCDRQASVVAAIHAGWKGLANGIIENSVNALPVDASELMVWLGPAIGPEVYQVGGEVRQAFVDKDASAASAFVQQDSQHWLMDIYQLARQRLDRLGIKQVYGGEYCTYSDSERFYSYRRDSQTGRMASLIWITA